MPLLASSFVLTLVANRTKFRESLAAAGREMQATQTTAQRINKGMAIAGAGGLATVATAVLKATSVYNDYGKTMRVVMNITGGSAEQASLLTAEWKRYGIESTRVAMGLKSLGTRLQLAKDGTKSAQEAFAALGITQQQIMSTPFIEMVGLVRQRMSELDDTTKRSQLSTLLFGRAAIGLTNWFAASADSVERLDAVIKKAGLVWGDKDIKTWKQFNEAQKDSSLIMAGLQITLARDFVPVLQTLLGWLNQLFMTFRPLVPMVKYFAAAFAAMFIIGNAAKIIVSFVAALKLLKIAMGGIANVGFTVAATLIETVKVMQEGAAANGLAGALGNLRTMLALVTRGISEMIIASGLLIAEFAVIAAGVIAIGWAYKQWSKADQERAQVTKDTTDNISKQLDRIIAKYGIASAQAEKFAKATASLNLQRMNDLMNGYNSFFDSVLRNVKAPWDAAGNLLGGGTEDAVRQSVANMIKIWKQAQDAFANEAPTGKGLEVLIQWRNKIQAIVDSTSGKAKEAAQIGLADVDNIIAQWQSVLGGTASSVADTAAITGDAAKGIATSLADIMDAIMNMPKSKQKLAAQNWKQLGTNLKAAMDDLLLGFGEATQNMADQTGRVGTITSALGNILSTLADAPKKEVKPLQQNFFMLADYVRKGSGQVIKAFKDFTAKQLEARAGKLGSVSGITSGLGGMLQALAEMPKKWVNPTMQNWKYLAKYILNGMNQVLAVFKNFDADTLELNNKMMTSVGGIASGLGSMLSALFSMPKKIVAPMKQAWGQLAVYVDQAMAQVMAVFSKYSTKSNASNAENMGSVGNIASSLADFINALADMPKKAIKPVKQSWGALTVYVESALKQVLQVFAELSNKSLGKEAERAGSIGQMAQSLGDFLGFFADAPKKTMRIIPQQWQALTNVISTAMRIVLNTFKENAKKLASEAARMGSVGEVAGALGSILSFFKDAPTTKLSIVTQKWKKLSAELKKDMTIVLKQFSETVKVVASEAARMGSVGGIADALGNILKFFSEGPDKTVVLIPQKWVNFANVIRKAMDTFLKAFSEKTKVIADEAARMESVGGIADSLGTIIKFFSEGPQESVQIVSQNWTGFAQTMKTAMAKVLAIFKETTEALANEAARMESVGGIAGSLGSILDFFVNAPTAAVAIIPQVWRSLAEELKRGMQEVLKVFKSFNTELLATKDSQLKSVAGMASSLGQILSYFADAPKNVIAVTQQNWAALGAALVNAVETILAQFKSVWSSSELSTNATDMGNIGTVVGVINDVISLASDLPSKMQDLIKFSRMSASFGSMWQNIGVSLQQAINGIAGALTNLPNTGKLQEAQAAIATLRDIFASMTDLAKSVPQAAYNAGRGVGAAAGGVPSIGGKAAVGVAAGSGGKLFDVNVYWSTFDGNPTNRELQGLAGKLKPHIDRMINEKANTGF